MLFLRRKRAIFTTSAYFSEGKGAARPPSDFPKGGEEDSTKIRRERRLRKGSPSGGAPAKRVRGEEKPSPSRFASHLSQGERLILVALGRAINDRPYYSSCGAGYHREAISSTAGGYHPAARESLADRISLRGRPSPRPGEASKKSTSDRGRDQNLYCSTGTRKLPFATLGRKRVVHPSFRG